MENKYLRTNTTVSLINYHFVFCPRYRRKIFLIPNVETQFKEAVKQICEQNDIRILAMECHIDHCHLFLSSSPIFSPADIMRLVKTNTSKRLRSEFNEFKNNKQLWTRSYFVSTAGNVSSDTIKQYVDSQKIKGY